MCPRCKEQLQTAREHAAIHGDEMTLEHPNDDEALCYKCNRNEALVILLGYTEIVEISGTPGATGLALHVGIAYLEAVYARVKPDQPGYGAVLTEDGTWTQGLLHLFENNTFSLT